MKKTISIIIPCFNVGGVVDRCLTSVVNQSIGLEHLEIILVNDASTDHTYDKLCAWEQRFSENITVINCQENGKQGTARNIGMSYATGQYIGFVDSDDWIEETMYETLFQAITEYDCEVSAILFQRETESGRVLRMSQNYQFNKRNVIQSMEERKHFLTRGGLPGGVYTKLYRRDFLEKNKFYFPENLFYEDNFWSRLIGHYLTSYVVINKIGYHYMITENSTTNGVGIRHMDRLKVETMLVEELCSRGLWQDYHDEIESFFLKSYWCMMLKRLIVQFPVFPYELLGVMRQTVKTLFPHYLQNPYLASFEKEEKTFLKLIELELSKEEMDWMIKAYREAFVKEALQAYES